MRFALTFVLFGKWRILLHLGVLGESLHVPSYHSIPAYLVSVTANGLGFAVSVGRESSREGEAVNQKPIEQVSDEVGNEEVGWRRSFALVCWQFKTHPTIGPTPTTGRGTEISHPPVPLS